MYSTPIFSCYLEFEVSHLKKMGLLTWRNLIKFQILLQTIIIWYCGKAWCVKCVILGRRIICHDMILLCFPPQVMLKFYLSFLFNITAPQNWMKKYPFARLSYSSLLVMISSSLISCMCKLFFERKKKKKFLIK